MIGHDFRRAYFTIPQLRVFVNVTTPRDYLASDVFFAAIDLRQQGTLRTHGAAEKDEQRDGANDVSHGQKHTRNKIWLTTRYVGLKKARVDAFPHYARASSGVHSPLTGTASSRRRSAKAPAVLALSSLCLQEVNDLFNEIAGLSGCSVSESNVTHQLRRAAVIVAPTAPVRS
jgi:hypothetical protein